MSGTSNVYKTKREKADQLNWQKSNNSITSSQHPTSERKSSVNSSTSTASTERKSSIGDISSLSELVKKKKKEARRAEIVAAVTKRLYSTRKKPEPAEVVPEQENNREEDAEPEELKLCQRARARLQELSKKALHAQRGRMQRLSNVEVQTDFDAHVLRVKEVAVNTEEFYCDPHVFFTNRRLLFTGYAYPSMRQKPAWSSLPVRNHSKLPDEDSFSDDSLESNHELDTTVEEKASLWNVISISSGKQFKTSGVDTENDQIFRNISTQTQECCHEKDVRSILQNDLHTEPDHFSICSNDMASLKQVDICEHECTNQPKEVAKFNQLSSCLHKDTQRQATSNMCRCEPPDMDKGIIREDTTLQLTDHNLYTITENSEYSESNDVTSGDYDSSYPASEPVVETERLENSPDVTIYFTDTCSCRDVTKSCPPSQLPACESFRSFHLPDLMNYPHIPYCEACTTHTKQNHNWQQCKDKMSQTAPDLYMHSAKLQKNSVHTTVETGSNTDIGKCSQNTATLYETKRRTCNQCNIPLTHSYNSDDDTKFLRAQSTKTEGTQCASTHLPVHAGTQTEITQLPSMTICCSTLLAAYSQLLQLSNPTLHLEDCTAVFILGHIPQPVIMKPVQWSGRQPSETVAVQTDRNREHTSSDENDLYNMKSQLGDKMQGSVKQSDVPASQRRAGVYQSACGQPTYHQMPNRLITLQSCTEGSHTSKADSSTFASAVLDMDNFSDDEDAPCLPSATVTPTQETEASGNQHWTDIKNLILGSDRNVFPYSITTEEENCSVQATNDKKKKCVSWSDLSGHGALHTEMVFASDHNLFDSSQVPLNKITKNSLFNVTPTEPSSHDLER